MKNNFFIVKDFEHFYIYKKEKYILTFLIKIINTHNLLLKNV